MSQSGRASLVVVNCLLSRAGVCSCTDSPGADQGDVVVTVVDDQASLETFLLFPSQYISLFLKMFIIAATNV